MIYFIKIKDQDYLKIGFTGNNKINSRLASIRTCIPFEIEVIALIEGDIMLESQLHNKFSLYNIRGEWFVYNEIIQDYINSCDKFEYTPPISKKLTIYNTGFKKYTDEQVEKSIEMYKSGIYVTKIAEYLNVSYNAASKLIARTIGRTRGKPTLK